MSEEPSPARLLPFFCLLHNGMSLRHNHHCLIDASTPYLMVKIAAIETLLEREPLSVPLLPNANETNFPELSSEIATLKDKRLQASLYLMNDDLHACHDIAQAHEGDAAMDLLHSILHRREGDFWNSCWWIARLKPLKHPLIPEIYGGINHQAALKRAKEFVGRVEKWKQNGGQDVEEEGELQRIQYKEMSTLVKHFSIL